jgi:iron(III) transport system substrate-binding protein
MSEAKGWRRLAGIGVVWIGVVGIGLGMVGTAAAQPPSAGVVNVYSSRHYDTDDRVYAAFEKATGIRVQVVEGDAAALLERLKREGERSPADLYLAVDAGRLDQAEKQGVFQPVRSSVLEQRVPANLRHPDGLWFGLTKRARIVVYAKDRVKAGELARYEDLADARWRGKVLVRSSTHVYNQSLVASMIAAHGVEATEAWCRGLVANFARKPQGGDRDQVKAIAAGEGDVAIVNSYYLAQMLAAPEAADREAAAKVAVLYPNQQDRGTHVNLAGAGVARHAPNRENAIRLLEFLTGDEAQQVFVGGNKEYSVVAGTPTVPELAAFGPFREDPLNAATFGGQAAAALQLMDRCGWR